MGGGEKNGGRKVRGGKRGGSEITKEENFGARKTTMGESVTVCHIVTKLLKLLLTIKFYNHASSTVGCYNLH